VRYEVTGCLGLMDTCHCTDCRKSHAAAFVTYIEVRWSDFHFVQGEENLTTHTASSGTKRSFCKTCGSILINWSDSDGIGLGISAGTLDTPIDLKPAYHTFVRSKASWHDILDNLPQYETSKED
jgi:hypothetical protein